MQCMQRRTLQDRSGWWGVGLEVGGWDACPTAAASAPDLPICEPSRSTAAFPLLFSSRLISMYTWGRELRVVRKETTHPEEQLRKNRPSTKRRPATSLLTISLAGSNRLNLEERAKTCGKRHGWKYEALSGRTGRSWACRKSRGTEARQEHTLIG